MRRRGLASGLRLRGGGGGGDGGGDGGGGCGDGCVMAVVLIDAMTSRAHHAKDASARPLCLATTANKQSKKCFGDFSF